MSNFETPFIRYKYRTLLGLFRPKGRIIWFKVFLTRHFNTLLFCQHFFTKVLPTSCVDTASSSLEWFSCPLYLYFFVYVFVFVFEGFANCVCGYGQQQPGDVLLSFVFNASTAASSQPLQTYRNISTRVEIQNVKKKSPSRHIVEKSKK